MFFQKTPMQKIIRKLRPRWTYAHFWYDFRYNYWTSPRNKKQLLNKQNFCTWDIVDSIAELTFRQFELFWETARHRFTDKDYLKMLRKEQENWYNAIITQEKIYRYITDIRIYNKKLLDETETEQWQYTHHFFVPSDKEYDNKKYSTMETEYLEGYFHITYSFDKEDKLKIKKIKPSEKNKHNLLSIEDKLNEIDNRFLKTIIDYRQYMWD